MVRSFETPAPSSCAHPRGKPEGALRIATLNVQMFNGGVKALSEFVRSATQGDLPDILCLQEVYKSVSHEFASQLGMSVVGSAGSDFDLYNLILVKRGGCAVATHTQKTPLVPRDPHSTLHYMEQRAASLVRFAVGPPGDDPHYYILAAGTHLDHLSERTRAAQLEVLLQEISAYPLSHSEGDAAPPCPSVEALDLVGGSPRRLDPAVSGAGLGSPAAAERRRLYDEVTAQLAQVEETYRRGSLSLEGYTAAVRAIKSRAPHSGSKTDDNIGLARPRFQSGVGGGVADGVEEDAGADALQVDGWLLLGDLNSLARGDYSEKAMEDVTQMRARAGVSPPAFDVVERIARAGGVDCKALSEVQPVPLNTSVYCVRVDYVWVSRSLLGAAPTMRRAVLQHVQPAKNETDHCLVIADFPFRGC